MATQVVSDNSSFRPQIGFYARPLDGSWTVIRTRRPDLSPGDRIVALDGTPIEQVVVALMPLLSASRCEAARASVLFYTHLLPSGASHWKTADGRNVPFAHPLAPVQVEGATLRVVANGTALLRFPNCTPETITEVSALLDDAPPYHNLIVDLRGNGGGHTPVDVIQRLVRGTWQSWAVESVQHEGLALANGENGRFIVRRPSFRLDANPRAFDGPLVILADMLTGSAAEDFIMAIRCSDRRLPAILIGEVTAGTTGQPYFEEFPSRTKRVRTILSRRSEPKTGRYPHHGRNPVPSCPLVAAARPHRKVHLDLVSMATTPPKLRRHSPSESSTACATVVLTWLGITLGVIGTGVVINEMTTLEAGVSVDDGILTMDGLVGEQDSKAGPRGGRHVSGPLTPENGGTGNPAQDWEVLTGGDYVRDPNSDHLIGPNGERYRPGRTGKGPRIDIPASGDKPHETMHYPEREETQEADNDEYRTYNE
ncbi:S41 family peptidase [Roseinatronobacter alkalisoli]|uniref:S41 family peptidase n=1 Tax=Roseinatronobacter alkalisoli TaxID=3028235 RepID=A0ABT5TFJ6_9RHOB|nr:S41 family peptidase [Roseinatronobacter sp. HJB301]MDD7973897.1 S41 family peptidase [Roseinatronobacter sp. HJB301]